MPWVRIDEKALEHPKIAGLPDGAFRLWIEGLTHCQKFLTDGFIADVSLRGLRAYSARRKANLLDVGLWDLSETGIRVHDFLQWNDSREHVMHARQLAKDRLDRYRERKRVSSSLETVTEETRSVHVVCSDVTEGKGGAGENRSSRAGAFCQWYEYTHDRLFRVGYMGTQKDYQSALQLVERFTDQQLRDAALVWFGMEDDFATTGTRTIPKFASRITGCLQTIQQRGIA